MKDLINNQTKDLLTVVKEAANEIRKKYLSKTAPLSDDDMKCIEDIIINSYSKQSVFWKHKNSAEMYREVLILDLKNNFVGGGVLNKNGDTEIKIG